MIAGQKLGPYRLIERRGIGGAGTVWLAEDIEGHPVAMKLLHPAMASDPAARVRLAREARTVNAVSSRGVAHVIDLELEEAQPFIVSEFIDGPTLASILKQGPLSRGEALDFARRLFEIVSEVHAAGVVHRDIKPGNIIMSAEGPVLIDFGIAQGSDDEALTAHGFVSGTAAYSCPEVLRGSRSDEASDWWAWAATVLHSLTGRSPFGKGSTEAVMNRVLNGLPDTDGLPPQVEYLFRQALASRKEERLTPDQLIAALDDSSAWSLEAPAPTLQATSVLPAVQPQSFPPSATRTYPVPQAAPASPADAVPTRPMPEAPAPSFPPRIAPPSYPALAASSSAGLPPVSDAYEAQPAAQGDALFGTPAAYVDAAAQPFNQMAPPHTPLMSLSVLAAFALLPVFSGGQGMLTLVGLILVLSTIGGFSRSLRIRRLEALGTRPSDWWVTLASTPLILIKVAVQLLLGLAAGAILTAVAAIAVWQIIPANIQETLFVSPFVIPETLYYSEASPAITEVTTNLYAALMIYALVFLILLIMWLLPSGRALNEGIALPARSLLPVVWIRGIVVLIVWGAVVVSWWLPVKSSVFWM